MFSRKEIGFEIGIRNMRSMCAGYDQRMVKAVEVVRRYTGLTIKIRNSGSADSSTCGAVLVRLSRITPEVLKDLLGMAHKFVTARRRR